MTARPSPRRRARARAAALVVATLALVGSLAAVPATAGPDPTATPADPTVVVGDDWVVTGAGGRYEVVLELPEPLEARAAAPTVVVDGVELDTAQVSEDGRTLTAVTDDPAVLEADAVEAGWSGQTPTDALPAVTGPTTTALPSAVPFPLDPTAGGPYGFQRISYDGGRQVVPLEGMGSTLGELAGVVHVPVGAPGERPVVLVLHGRGGPCRTAGGAVVFTYPCTAAQTEVASADGFTTLGETLASFGYVVVSISANAISAYDNSRARDLGTAARGSLVLTHLDLLARADAGTSTIPALAPLQGRLDLDDVGLVGHSRGARASCAPRTSRPSGTPP
ncbi:hypothetical protein C8046_13120 [Serinibacter arcticus]|uniref:Secreted protein n=1 Tax=Serinibacter arcticus TaxID=1655435 RepID=A0A2U1ZWT8_9MICO|nr:hypothetical protein [Serinibacter arcticus]PWD51456.1 hypothetical protein C8046_13120 [Serinibacter arcticus]